MAILNFGSLNIDHVYNVDHFVRPGETLSSTAYSQFAGGKGANQSIALAQAGAAVLHAGKLGHDGAWLKRKLEGFGVDTRYLDLVDGPSGHAVIQVAGDGENAIILHGGANHAIGADDAQRILGDFGPGDTLLLQNEISAMPDIMACAAEQGLRVVFNPAPMHRDVPGYPLDKVDCFIVNEIEAAQLSGREEEDRVLAAMRDAYPAAAVVLTLGARGVRYADGESELSVPAREVETVDTTAAGDTFIGYFLAAQADGADVRAALDLACRAAAVCVTRPGASDSIPSREEVMQRK